MKDTDAHKELTALVAKFHTWLSTFAPELTSQEKFEALSALAQLDILWDRLDSPQ